MWIYQHKECYDTSLGWGFWNMLGDHDETVVVISQSERLSSFSAISYHKYVESHDMNFDGSPTNYRYQVFLLPKTK